MQLNFHKNSNQCSVGPYSADEAITEDKFTLDLYRLVPPFVQYMQTINAGYMSLYFFR